MVGGVYASEWTLGIKRKCAASVKETGNLKKRGNVNLMFWFRGLVISTGLMAGLASAQNFEFSTIAGLAGSLGGESRDGTNNAARFDGPSSIVVDSQTNLYVSDYYSHTIRRISPAGTNWIVTTIAGMAYSFGTADGTNSAARFAAPTGLALDAQGNLYVADFQNHTIRKITRAGTNWIVTTIAGLAGTFGSSNGTNSAARFYYPRGVSVDSEGNVFVADTSNSTIRKLSPEGTNWIVTTIAGLASVQDSLDGTNSGARFNRPAGTAVDANQNIYVSDYFNSAIRKIRREGTNWIVTTIAGAAGQPGSADGTNDATRFTLPEGITAGADGIFVADFGANNLRRLRNVGTNWIATTIGGQVGNPGSADGTNTAALFHQPNGIAVDEAGNVYVADSKNNTIRLGRRVNVTAFVPPDFLTVTTANSSIVFTWSAMVGRSYQLQYKTNLLQSAWLNLGSVNVATNEIMSRSDLLGPEPQRFYRMSLLP